MWSWELLKLSDSTGATGSCAADLGEGWTDGQRQTAEYPEGFPGVELLSINSESHLCSVSNNELISCCQMFP